MYFMLLSLLGPVIFRCYINIALKCKCPIQVFMG